jgi:hypothetical protein
MKTLKTYQWVPSSIFALALACGGPQRAGSAGATIEGVLRGAGGAAPAGVQVSVAPTSLSTTSDGTGHFLLEGVPAGSGRLRFQGPGLDARLDVGMLVDGMKMVIDANASGSQVEGRVEVEFSGAIESKTAATDKGTCVAPAIGCLKISGLTVIVAATTEIEDERELDQAGKQEKKLTFADLKAGEFARVEGTLQKDGSVLASEIEVLALGIAPPKAELEGTIDNINAAQKSLTVSGHTVLTNTDTRIRRGAEAIAFASLKVGERVHVRGTLQKGGSILASKIKVAPGFVARVELEGIVEKIDAPTAALTVSSLTVRTDGQTRIELRDKLIAFSDLRVGDRVHVRGTPQAGSILARVIRVEAQ